MCVSRIIVRWVLLPLDIALGLFFGEMDSQRVILLLFWYRCNCDGKIREVEGLVDLIR
jgi:hypothetical protein